jgi:hypothetical protein
VVFFPSLIKLIGRKKPDSCLEVISKPIFLQSFWLILEGLMGKRITPPFFKGELGGLYNRLIIPLNPPLEKGDLKNPPAILLHVDSLSAAAY